MAGFGDPGCTPAARGCMTRRLKARRAPPDSLTYTMQQTTLKMPPFVPSSPATQEPAFVLRCVLPRHLYVSPFLSASPLNCSTSFSSSPPYFDQRRGQSQLRRQTARRRLAAFCFQPSFSVFYLPTTRARRRLESSR